MRILVLNLALIISAQAFAASNNVDLINDAITTRTKIKQFKYFASHATTRKELTYQADKLSVSEAGGFSLGLLGAASSEGVSSSSARGYTLVEFYDTMVMNVYFEENLVANMLQPNQCGYNASSVIQNVIAASRAQNISLPDESKLNHLLKLIDRFNATMNILSTSMIPEKDTSLRFIYNTLLTWGQSSKITINKYYASAATREACGRKSSNGYDESSWVPAEVATGEIFNGVNFQVNFR